MNEMKKLIPILALVLALAACAGETSVVVVTATPLPPTATSIRDRGVEYPSASSITTERPATRTPKPKESQTGSRITLGNPTTSTPKPTEVPLGDQPAATPAPEPTPLGGGGRIAFSSDRDGDFEIYLMNWDGTDQMRLTNQPTHDFFPEFSPDGDTLLFFAVDAESDPPSGEFQFVGIDGTYEGTFGAFGFGSASWSPNVIARSIDVGEGNTEILIAEFGVPPYILTSDPAPDLDPAWSPDGKTLAFVSLRDGIQKIYIMDENGNNLRRLTDTVRVEAQPSWSPDGTRIAFVSGDNVTTQIYIMNSDGTEVTQVTNGPGFNENPTWSPDGTMLAFWSNRSGNLQIYIIRLDGTQLTRLTSNAFNDENPDWAP